MCTRLNDMDLTWLCESCVSGGFTNNDFNQKRALRGLSGVPALAEDHDVSALADQTPSSPKDGEED
jgi:hypothetical protein